MKIQLDYCDDRFTTNMSHKQMCKMIEADVGKFAPLKASILDRFGPGGGNLVIYLEGTEADIRKYLGESYCQNGCEDVAREVEFFMEDAE